MHAFFAYKRGSAAASEKYASANTHTIALSLRNGHPQHRPLRLSRIETKGSEIKFLLFDDFESVLQVLKAKYESQHVSHTLGSSWKTAPCLPYLGLRTSPFPMSEAPKTAITPCSSALRQPCSTSILPLEVWVSFIPNQLGTAGERNPWHQSP